MNMLLTSKSIYNDGCIVCLLKYLFMLVYCMILLEINSADSVVLSLKYRQIYWFSRGRTCAPFGGFLHCFYTCIFLSKAGPHSMRLCPKFISNIPLNAPHMKSRCARPRLAMKYPHLEGLNRTFSEIFSF